MDDFHFAWPFLIPIVAIIGAFTYAVVQTLARARVREQEVRYRERSPGRHRRAGVSLMGVGFGLIVIIGVAGDSMSSGIGVGGFLVIMGFAFFINGLFDNRRDDYPSTRPGPAGPLPEPPRRD